MIKKSIAIFFLAFIYLSAQEERLLESRKQELELQTREFDEARQALEAYKASFEALQKEKMQALLQKEAELNATLQKIEQTKRENDAILKKSEANLKAIEDKTQGRITEIYSSMKDSAIADVLSQMDS